ncbi:hypothetical protein BT69DRAFT_717789 [Atractiella rhizophila]|nr:hypothetical protein BT69DRAFT_717789 [Atractiella rhizophila]
MITGMVKAHDWLAGTFTEPNQSLDLHHGFESTGSYFGGDSWNDNGATVHGGQEGRDGIYSTPELPIGSHTLYLSRIKVRSRADLEKAEDPSVNMTDAVDVLQKAMLMVWLSHLTLMQDEVKFVVASDDDLSSLCAVARWNFTTEDWTEEQAIALLSRNIVHLQVDEKMLYLQFEDTGDVINKPQTGPLNPFSTFSLEACDRPPPQEIYGNPWSQPRPTSPYGRSLNASTTTTTTAVAGSSRNSLPETSKEVGLLLQADMRDSTFSSDMFFNMMHTPSTQPFVSPAIQAAWATMLSSQRPREVVVKAFEKKDTILRTAIQSGLPTLYGAIYKPNKTVFPVDEHNFLGLQSSCDFLTFALTDECPRVWSSSGNSPCPEEVFPWTQWDLWLKGIAASFGYCNVAPSYTSCRNVMEKPGTICQHFERCFRHRIEGLNLTDMCAALRRRNND